MKRLLRFALFALLALVVLFVSFLMISRRASPAALAGLESDQVVHVDQDAWISLTPLAAEPDTGLVLYPGGFVDARAYSGSARQIAAEGFLVVLVKPPLSTAFLAVGAAGEVISAYPEIERWAVGGHSLGGVAAARYTRENPDDIDGLVLWASYPAAADDLSALDLKVLSMYGERDGLAPESEILSWAHLLPADTTFISIAGGNHAQFGRYGNGTQAGDNPAAIGVDDQERILAQEVVAFLEALEGESR